MARPAVKRSSHNIIARNSSISNITAATDKKPANTADWVKGTVNE